MASPIELLGGCCSSSEQLSSSGLSSSGSPSSALIQSIAASTSPVASSARRACAESTPMDTRETKSTSRTCFFLSTRGFFAFGFSPPSMLARIMTASAPISLKSSRASFMSLFDRRKRPITNCALVDSSSSSSSSLCKRHSRFTSSNPINAARLDARSMLQ